MNKEHPIRAYVDRLNKNDRKWKARQLASAKSFHELLTKNGGEVAKKLAKVIDKAVEDYERNNKIRPSWFRPFW